MQSMAQALAQLDVLSNFAERAVSLNFCKPELLDQTGIEIIAGRHPVVEDNQTQPFIANDLIFNDDTRMHVITGPNMGGKSTYCLLYTSPSPRDQRGYRMPSSA